MKVVYTGHCTVFEVVFTIIKAVIHKGGYNGDICRESYINGDGEKESIVRFTNLLSFINSLPIKIIINLPSEFLYIWSLSGPSGLDFVFTAFIYFNLVINNETFYPLPHGR